MIIYSNANIIVYYLHTFKIPRICIFATISAVNKIVTNVSATNVIYCNGGCFTKVFGVFKDTDANDINAHNRIKRRTQSYIKKKNKRFTLIL